MRIEFSEFRDLLLNEFNNVGLIYKVYGGIAVQCAGFDRKTEDGDITIPIKMDLVYKLIEALEKIEFSTKDEILEDVFGADPHTEEYLFAMVRLRTKNPKYEGYVIDVSFDFGSITYDNIETYEADINGIKVQIATPEYLLKMKRNIKPPRDKDLEDIKFLENLLNKKIEGSFFFAPPELSGEFIGQKTECGKWKWNGKQWIK